MTEYRLLVTCPLITDSIDEYADRLSAHGIGYDVVEVDQQLSESALIDCIEPYDAILAGDDELTAEVFRRAPNLKVVSKWGIGTDNIDTAAAADFGVTVTNTPGAFSDEVADVVAGYAVMLTRQLHQIDAAVRAGDWQSPRGTSLHGKTCGIVGVGSIGRAVARRFDAMGMNILANDVVEFADTLPLEVDIDTAGKEELFERSDIVTLHCPLTPETADLVDAEALNLLGSDGYLINTARGGLVVQDDLVAALEDGTIAGAALDVYEEEPLRPSSPLTELENVVLGSHNAQNTIEAVQEVNERAVRNVVDVLTE